MATIAPIYGGTDISWSMVLHPLEYFLLSRTSKVSMPEASSAPGLFCTVNAVALGGALHPQLFDIGVLHRPDTCAEHHP